MARFNEMNVKKQYDMIKELSNNFKERFIISKCPLVIGSKLPG